MSGAKKKLDTGFSLSANEVAYLDGLLAAFEELPDGAWQAACEDAIERCGEFKGRDPLDVWLAWIEATGHDVAAD